MQRTVTTRDSLYDGLKHYGLVIEKCLILRGAFPASSYRTATMFGGLAIPLTMFIGATVMKNDHLSS